MLLKRELIKIGLEGNTSEEVERAFANLFVEKKWHSKISRGRGDPPKFLGVKF